MNLHKCEPGYNIKEEQPIFPSKFHGAAIANCTEDIGGRLWVDNEEYGTQVNFCPFCGYKAQVQVKWTPESITRCTIPQSTTHTQNPEFEKVRMDKYGARWTTVDQTMAKILNLGAGNRIIEGAINHDLTLHRDEISMAHDLDILPWPWDDNAFEQIQLISVAEHLKLTLIETLNECWRVIEPGGRLTIKYPVWTSSTSYDDPTHRWHWSLNVLDFVDPNTRHGKDNHYYTPCKWRILDKGLVHGRNVKAVMEPVK